MKKQFYILTSHDVIDKYEGLNTDDFIRSITPDDVHALIIGDINFSDSSINGLDWLWILEEEIKQHILTITNNTIK